MKSRFTVLRELLIKNTKYMGGRNSRGKITVYHKGGRHKRFFRWVDWKGLYNTGFVIGIDYNPMRNTYLVKLINQFSSKNWKQLLFFYRLAEINSTELNFIFVFKQYFKNIGIFKKGNISLLLFLKKGDLIYSVSNLPFKKQIFARAGGTFCKFLYFYTKNLVVLVLPSKEKRLFSIYCSAFFGENHKRSLNLYKAGVSRWLGKRPTVRGVAMNPVDHPHGGGEGKTSGGRPSTTPWGKLSKGVKTRKKSKKRVNFEEKI